MAMPGQRPHYLLKSIQRRHFDTLAKRMGLGAEAERVIAQMVTRTPGAIEQVQAEIPKGFPQGLLDRVLSGLERSSKALKGSTVM
jgi:serine/threonine-protein kinase HipA